MSLFNIFVLNSSTVHEFLQYLVIVLQGPAAVANAQCKIVDIEFT